MIIAFEGFRDEEYAEPKDVLEKAGVEVITASTKTGTATGKLGLKTKVDVALDQVQVVDYDAVLFIGGPGSYQFHHDPKAHKIVKETAAAGKVLGGICAGVNTLAQAGALKGKTVTSFAGVAEDVEKTGANYTGKGVEVDGKIVTADGPAHAKIFGEAICRLLSSPLSSPPANSFPSPSKMERGSQ
ncbi:DJ-1/PfpI family protein [Candidatus Saganbacteria bacterium]|nr:DJ-1/PfpI family protein [Candidatus Saganbacteria bacterium]